MKAILKRKNGEIRNKYVSSIEPYIDLFFIEDRVHTPLEEYTDCTPDNIINIGGFTNIENQGYRKIRYELTYQILSTEGDHLIYTEI